MIVAKRHIHHRADDHLAIYGDGAVFNAVQAEHGALRRIDDWGGHQAAKYAAVADGKGAALHIRHGHGAGLCLCAKFADGFFDLGKAHAIGAANNRNDQAIRCADGNRNVEIVEIDDLITLNLGVNGGNVTCGQRRRFGEKAHEAQTDAMFLFK